MRRAKHVWLFCVATTAWTLFYLAGLPSRYYQAWPNWALVAGSLAIAAAMWPIAPGLLRSTGEPPARAAAWCIVYLTVPLTFYDFVVLKLHGGQDWSYLWRYWYLTWFNLVPPVVFPLAARRMRGGRRDG